MSGLEEIVKVNKKLLEMQFTNKESIYLASNPKVVNYLIGIHNCADKYLDTNEKMFTTCICESTCPQETLKANKCFKENSQNLGVCVKYVTELVDCLKMYSNLTLAETMKGKLI